MQNILRAVVQWGQCHRKEIIWGAVLFLVATVSFALGYLANREFSHAPILIEKCSKSQ